MLYAVSILALLASLPAESSTPERAAPRELRTLEAPASSGVSHAWAANEADGPQDAPASRPASPAQPVGGSLAGAQGGQQGTVTPNQQKPPGAPAPEPAAFFLVGTGLLGLALTRRRKKPTAA